MTTEKSESRPVVYWRPMCGFCMRLFGALEQAGVEVELRNIWDDPEAAAFVRSVNNGAETVPTVVLPDGQVLTNPAPETLTKVRD
jgi:mycoredoxin